MIFSVLLNNVTNSSVSRLSTKSLVASERLLFEEWKKIFAFRFKNDNILDMHKDVSARFEYNNAEQLAYKSAAYMLDSFTPVTISCVITAQDLYRVVCKFEDYVSKYSDENCFNGKLRAHMSEFIVKTNQLDVFGEHTIKGFDLSGLFNEFLFGREYYVPPILQKNIDLGNKWKYSMAQLSHIFPIGGVINSDILVKINFQEQ